MNKLKNISLFIFVIFFSINSFASELLTQLENLPGVVSVKKLETNEFFAEKYLIIFEQYLDPSVPEA
ncbi:MAG: hypothetical protein C0596_07590 [Marinilabiliales bacterium]|nr:MAG: hypothetical protein C0596_07590 [Marinilabiliales bacterium]